MKKAILKDNILDKNFFPDEGSKKFFIERLKMNDSIIPHFEERKIFDERKGDFLIPTGEINDTKRPQTYDLFLPKGLKFHEVYALLYTIDQKLGKDQFTSVASIATVTKTFLAKMMKSGQITEPEIVDFVKEHNIPSPVVEYIKNTPIKISSQTKNAITKAKSGDSEEQAEYIQDTLETGTSKLFFERGKQTLFDYMQVFTQADYDKIREEKKYDIYLYKVTLKKEREKYDRVESTLKGKIGIIQYQKELNQLRKEGDIERLAKKEYEAAEKILQELYKYPRDVSDQSQQDANNASPAHILKTKEMACLGKAILGHVFLSSLGINHEGAQVPGHSALVVKCSNKKEYYFDPVNKEQLKEIQRSDGIEEGNGVYTYISGLGSLNEYDNRLYVGHSENILIVQMYNNKGNALYDLKQYEEAIKRYNKAIKLDPKNSTVYNNKGNVLNNLKQYNEAIKWYDAAIKLDPKNSMIYNNKGTTLYNLEQYEAAIRCYDKTIELDPKNSAVYCNKGNALYNLEQYEAAIRCYNKTIELDPKDIRAKTNKERLEKVINILRL